MYVYTVYKNILIIINIFVFLKFGPSRTYDYFTYISMHTLDRGKKHLESITEFIQRLSGAFTRMLASAS